MSRTQSENTIALVFQRIMGICVAFAMLLMGCELEWEVVKAYMVRPLAPGAAMFCQYVRITGLLCSSHLQYFYTKVFMPVMAYLVGLLLLSNSNIMARYGLILVGSSPGGSFSNFWTGG